MADSLKEQVEGQAGSLTQLYDSMKQLEDEMAEAKSKKDQIIARARTAKAATKVNDMLSGVGTASSTAAFDRMSEKVEQMEAEADVSKQLAQSTTGSGGLSLESQFKSLEASGGVEDELKALKAAQQALPAVDAELEEMKKAMAKEADEPEATRDGPESPPRSNPPTMRDRYKVVQGKASDDFPTTEVDIPGQ